MEVRSDDKRKVEKEGPSCKRKTTARWIQDLQIIQWAVHMKFFFRQRRISGSMFPLMKSSTETNSQCEKIAIKIMMGIGIPRKNNNSERMDNSLKYVERQNTESKIPDAATESCSETCEEGSRKQRDKQP